MSSRTTSCTYWFSGWWEECCKKHDKDYYRSGISRKESDKRLRECVIEKAKYKPFGVIVGYWMYVGVRIGGRWRYERKQRGSYGEGSNSYIGDINF